MSRPAAVLVLAAVLVRAAPAASEVVTPVPISTAPAIAAIRVERVNVFDPRVEGEDWWGFRIANRIHILTKEPIVRRELLLGPGDHWDPLKAIESERNMRSLGIFRKAEIAPRTRPDGKLDLSVRTQDSWTLNAQFSVGTEGGDHFFIYGVEEDNLLGSGKGVGFLHSQVGPKIRNSFFYHDPRFLGSRFRLSPFYSKTERGNSIRVDLVRPFFSLETPYAMGLEWSRSIDEAILYQDAAERSKFLQRAQVVSGAYGLRLEPDRLFAQRVEAGWYSQKDQFHPIDATLPGTLPGNRELSGPVLGYSWVQPKFVKETYIDRVERIEDFNMGNELRLLGGYMGLRTGSDRDRWIFNAIDQQGLYLSPGRFALSQVGTSGRLTGGKWENSILFANLNLFWKTTWLFPATWVSHLEANSGRNLDRENQVILGGNNGLRGYKNNSFTGGKSVLLNLENRFFFPGEYLHLLRFGGAVFFDSGAVVPERSGISFARFKSDIGAGLRLSSTRSQSGGVLRVDLAYALNPGPGGSRWVVSIRGGQAFQIFNSSTRSVRQSPASKL